MSVFPTIAELRAKAQPDEVLARANAEHWSGRLYLRHFSIYVTRLLVPTGISANGVTWLMALIGWWVPHFLLQANGGHYWRVRY